LVDRGTFVVLLAIFVAEHLDVDMFVEVVQARGIGVNSVRQLCEVFLAHQRLELGKLPSSNSLVQTQADDLLEEPVEVFVEELISLSDAPRTSVDNSSVNRLSSLLAHLNEVKTEDVGSKTDAVSV
jgi:hypothetical protein